MSLPPATPASALNPSALHSSIEAFIDCPTGTLEYSFASPVLTWSDEVYRIHGYTRGEIVPSLDLGFSHVDPAQRDAAKEFWENLTTTGGPLSVYLSLRDAQGRPRRILVSGDLIREHGARVGVWALVVDLTRSVHADTREIANQAVAASALSRSVIEQAKGILMGRAGLDATEAFQRISQRSQTTNRKVVVVAQEIIDRALELTEANGSATRTRALLELFDRPNAQE
jgi:hypothetical protein